MEKYKDLLLGILIGILAAYLIMPKKVLMVVSEKEFEAANAQDK